MQKWIEILYPKNLTDTKGINISNDFIKSVYDTFQVDKKAQTRNPDEPYAIPLAINHSVSGFVPLGWVIDLNLQSDGTLWALLEDDTKLKESIQQGYTRPGKISAGLDQSSGTWRLTHVSVEAGTSLPALPGLREQSMMILSLDRKKIIENLENKKMLDLELIKQHLLNLFDLDIPIELGAACPPAVKQRAEHIIEKTAETKNPVTEEMAYAIAWQQYNEGKLSQNLDNTTEKNQQEQNMVLKKEDELELSQKVTELTDAYKKEIEKLNLNISNVHEQVNLELKHKDERIAADDVRIKELENDKKKLNLSKQIEALSCIPPAKMEEAIQYALNNDSEKFLELLKGLPKLNLSKDIVTAIDPTNDPEKIREERYKKTATALNKHLGIKEIKS